MESLGCQDKESGWQPVGIALQTRELIPGVGALTGQSQPWKPPTLS